MGQSHHSCKTCAIPRKQQSNNQQKVIQPEWEQPEIFYQLVPACRLCQAGWWTPTAAGTQHSLAMMQRTQNGIKHSITPQNTTKYLQTLQNGTKIYGTLSKRCTKTEGMAPKPCIWHQTNKTPIDAAAASFMALKCIRCQLCCEFSEFSRWIWQPPEFVNWQFSNFSLTIFFFFFWASKSTWTNFDIRILSTGLEYICKV